MDRLKEIVTTFFYTGYSPVASGTAGSAGALLLAFVLPASLVLGGTTVGFGVICVFMAALCMVLGVPLGSWAEKRWGKKDPGPFVIDEVAGYFVALFRFEAPKPEIGELLVAFFLFRLFDVIKPPPARRIESLPGGWGIMLDDIIAGLYALLGVVVYRQYFLELSI